MTTARQRAAGHPASSYAWHVGREGVLVVVDRDPAKGGWRSVTNDAEGVVRDLWELRPELLRQVPLIAYRDSTGCWDALRVGPDGMFAGYVGLGCATEAEAVARVLALVAQER